MIDHTQIPLYKTEVHMASSRQIRMMYPRDAPRLGASGRVGAESLGRVTGKECLSRSFHGDILSLSGEVVLGRDMNCLRLVEDVSELEDTPDDVDDEEEPEF